MYLINRFRLCKALYSHFQTDIKTYQLEGGLYAVAVGGHSSNQLIIMLDDSGLFLMDCRF